ncbi:extracellular catalytic domain type 1 short-chain-length polyhydroxyalkanoate depolymerase [Azospirillum sp.]|uniref:extracellular catalytic domain type 1 short-chain-length polyhydroxyalkanoate depolymerase n=1 Tax=Azospirillum sp. TaxID=34012 RepID=UPI003D71CF85
MLNLGQTTEKLAKHRRQWQALKNAAAQAKRMPGAEAGPLGEVTDFGSNPGNLRMLTHVPARLQRSAPLVVALHGCLQTASGYGYGAGWVDLADRFGFALLLPEQRRDNNANACFNWFEPRHTRRGSGEAESIRAMVARMVADHGLDRGRVYVTGLSAGGAMTSVMLATHPELFAGGAVVAGLPYGAAGTVGEAFDAMFQPRSRPRQAWGDLVRSASSHGGPWPRVAVWHGDADATVLPRNADEVVKQWLDLHALGPVPDVERTAGVHTERVWRNAAGEPAVELHTLSGMAHGVAVCPGEGDGRCGRAGPFILDIGVSSTWRIAESWGLTQGVPEVEARRPAPEAKPQPQPQPSHAEHALGAKIQSVIARALEAAGLMKR